MTVAALAILGCLAILNARLTDSAFYPPAVFAGFWAGLLGLLLLRGDYYYPLLDGSLAVFVGGAVCFSLGGMCGLRACPAPGRPLSPQHRAWLNAGLNLAVLVMAATFPVFLWRLNELVNVSRIFDPIMAVRYELCNNLESRRIMGFMVYAISLFNFFTLVAWSESDGSFPQRFRCWLMALITLAYYLCTASRLGAMTLVFSLIWIAILRRRKLAIKPLLLGSCVVLGIFAAVAIVLGKGGSRDAGVVENIVSVYESFTNYLLGGLVAFNEVVHDPAIIRMDVFRFFSAVANAPGANHEIILNETVYVPTPTMTNVFTLYASPYAQFGWLGAATYLFCLGGVSAWLYRAVTSKQAWAVPVYAYFAGCLLLTAAIDPFLPALSVWIQLMLFCWIVYQLPRYFLGMQSSFRPGSEPRAAKRRLTA